MNLQILFLDVDGSVGQALEIALVAGVRRIGNQFAQKDFLVGVNRIDHQVQQLFALGLKLTHSHRVTTSLVLNLWLALACLKC